MNELIIKPWGQEYCAYRNKHMAIWVVAINKGAATSLHKHVTKESKMVVLDGLVKIEFRSRAPMRLKPLEWVRLKRGQYHRIHGMSKAVLLEVESPEDKSDVTRLEDGYNRVDKEIEKPQKPLPKGALVLAPHSLRQFAGCTLFIASTESKEAAPVKVSLLNGQNLLIRR